MAVASAAPANQIGRLSVFALAAGCNAIATAAAKAANSKTTRRHPAHRPERTANRRKARPGLRICAPQWSWRAVNELRYSTLARCM